MATILIVDDEIVGDELLIGWAIARTLEAAASRSAKQASARDAPECFENGANV